MLQWRQVKEDSLNRIQHCTVTTVRDEYSVQHCETLYSKLKMTPIITPGNIELRNSNVCKHYILHFTLKTIEH